MLLLFCNAEESTVAIKIITVVKGADKITIVPKSPQQPSTVLGGNRFGLELHEPSLF